MKVACPRARRGGPAPPRPAREPRLPSPPPCGAGWGREGGGRRVRGSGAPRRPARRPVASPPACVPLPAPGPPRHVPRGGPEGSGGGVCPARLPPPHPNARGAGHGRLSPTPARGPRAARVLRSRLAGCAARRAAAFPVAGPLAPPRRLPRRRPWAGPPRPVVVGRPAALGLPRGRRAPPPAPSGPRGSVPSPPPPHHASRRLVCLGPVSPVLSTSPPARWAPSFPSEPLPPALCPRWWWGEKGARERGRG